MEVASIARGQVGALPMRDKTGRHAIVVVLKYTFVVDPFGRVELDERNGAGPRLVDTYNGPDATTASIRFPSDLCDRKPGTDVLLVGHAHPPLRGNADHVDVSLQMGPVQKTVRAYGLRVWQAGAFGGVQPGPARPMRDPVPLLYELAWGGLDLDDAERPVGEWRNTVGRGVARDPLRLVGQPAAQLENPAHPLGAGRDNHPASFGALHRHWQPRISFAGTYDVRWRETKMPLLPDDFDDRFHVTAPPDQWSPVPLRGDEPILVTGATPEGRWAFRLPRVAPGFSSHAEGRRTEHRTHLDTVLIDADSGRVELTFRAAVPMPRKLELIDRIEVFEKDVI